MDTTMTGGGNRNGNGTVTCNESGGDDCDHNHDEEDDVFRADPLLPALERGEQDEYFSLGLVVNWPLLAYQASNRVSYDTEKDDDDAISCGGGGGDDNNGKSNNNNRYQPLQEHYESFCSRVQTECFSQCQNREDNCDNKSSTMLFLPLESLHITVATLMSARKTTKNDVQKQQQQQQQDETVRRWKELLVRASQHEGWPKTKKLRLKIRGALITESAGILLWDDLSNGIWKIRQCLHSAVKDEEKREQEQKHKRYIATAAAAGGATQHDNNDQHHDSSSSCSSSPRCSNDGFMDGFRTPDIIHTTFMRYRTPPPSGQSPAKANSILQRNIVCSVGNGRNDNDSIPHPLFQQQTSSLQRNRSPGKTEATNNNVDTVDIDCTKMVNCKIYLQPPPTGLKPKTFDNKLCKAVDDEDFNGKPAAVAKGLNGDRDDGDNDYHEVYLTLPIGSGSIP